MRCEPLEPGLLHAAEAAGNVAMTENIDVAPAYRLQGRVNKEAGGGHG
jgi:hypothetical protein